MTALKLDGRRRWVDFRGVPKAGWDAFYEALADDDVEGAIRYIDGGSEAKQITSAERQAAARHGRKILLVDETGTGDAWDAADDYAAGQARGRGALTDAKAQGFGAVGIAAAADAHADVRQVADATRYATGFAAIVGKTWAGFYGFREVLVAVRAASVVSWYWLAGSMPSAEDARWIAFWQDNRTRRFYAGVECDINWRLDGPLPGGEDDEVDAATIKAIAQQCAVEVHNRTVVDLVTGKALQARYVWADAARLGAVAAAKESGADGVNVDELAAALAPRLSTAMLPQLQAAIERVANAGAQITADAVVAELAKDLAAGVAAGATAEQKGVGA